MSSIRHASSLVALAILSFIFGGAQEARTKKALSSDEPVPVPQVFQTQDWRGSNVDSVALWRDRKGDALLFVTAKEADVIYVCDGLKGTMDNSTTEAQRTQRNLFFCSSQCAPCLSW